ncbi:hydroxyisourate hydrolase [Paenibacillus sp. JX-17]|uniref:5-hydroxyisourate hydrolase n=1 Tax=Paenibacillus lacisoli TaxID=3064525 RepID=A0ABT9C8J8_9BACL|nr:hydroxyisourate hydrolase [Paenibacillus sp. JX-17]MDO7905586.1 hydroxyisourate hydrolase [Paenibacillus sp. JX-17]
MNEPSETGGKLTSHVLNLVNGRPAVHLLIQLYALRDGKVVEREQISERYTNADGRVDAPFMAGKEMQEGVYELVFHAGDYLRDHNMEPVLFEIIPIRFTIADRTASYHIPLLIAPGGYSTYRGS